MEKTKINLGITTEWDNIDDKTKLISYCIKNGVQYIANDTIMKDSIAPMHNVISNMFDIINLVEDNNTVFCSYPLYDYYDGVIEDTIGNKTILDIIDEHYYMGYRAISICVTPFSVLDEFKDFKTHTVNGEILSYFKENGYSENPITDNLEEIEKYCALKDIELFIDFLYKPVTIAENISAYTYECNVVDDIVNLSGAIFEIGGYFNAISKTNIAESGFESNPLIDLNNYKLIIFESNCISGPCLSDTIDQTSTALFGLQTLLSLLERPANVHTVQIMVKGSDSLDKNKSIIKRYIDFVFLINLRNREYAETLKEFKSVDFRNRADLQKNSIAYKHIDINMRQITKKEVYAPILVIGPRQSGKTEFAKIFVNGNENYKYFNVFDYLKSEHIHIGVNEITEKMLLYGLSGVEHTGKVFDAPFRTYDEMIIFDKAYGLRNYAIVYTANNINKNKSRELSEDEVKILGFLKQNEIDFKFVQKIYKH